MAAVAPVVGATVTVVPAKLNARTAPGGGKVKVVRKKGFKFKITARRKVKGLWWVRAKQLWYAYKHLKPIVHKRIVDVAALNARDKPSTKSKVVGTRKRGYVIQYVAIVKGDGLSWLMSRWGNFYAAKHTRKYAVAPKGGGGGGKVKTPAPGYSVSTPWRKKPNNSSYWRARGYHTGDDYAAPTGAKVVAVTNGKIVRRWDSVLGNVALLYSTNGDTYWYCHLSRYGATGKVKAGQVIGYVGATGSGAMGPHLHFEMRDGHTTSWAGPDRKPTW